MQEMLADAGLLPELGKPPVKEMASHSSIFAKEISWTEEPGRSQRVGHN